MAEVKYIYNSNTLSYEKTESSLADKLKKLFSYVLAGIIFGTVFIILTYLVFDSPKEQMLKREINQMVLEFELLNEKSDKISKVLEDIQQRDDNVYRIIFEAEPIPSEIRKAGIGGVNRYKALAAFDHGQLMEKSARRLDKIAKQLYVQSKSFDDVFEMAKNKSDMLAAIPAIQPIANKNLTRVASGYGTRIHPIYKTKKLHTGMDFTAPRGTEIYATGDGKVKKASRSRRGYGSHVIIDHGYGYQTLYAHMKKLAVRPGQKVKRGEIIGYVGNSGVSVGPHLHYEVIKNGRKINPVNFYYNDLSPEEYDKMIVLSSQANQSFD
jgi:murein DD-endopeptidase MepM/ murein hydrolase activator NlpD